MLAGFIYVFVRLSMILPVVVLARQTGAVKLWVVLAVPAPGDVERARQSLSQGLSVPVAVNTWAQWQQALGLDRPVFLFELVLGDVVEGRLPKFSELSKFPETRRDLALIAGRDVASSAVLELIRDNAGEWLTDLRLFDVYQGKGIDPDRKSLAVGLTWQHPSRTLNDDEVNTTLQNILTSLEQRLNTTLRK